MKKAIAIILSIMLVLVITLPAAAVSTIAVKSIKLDSSKINLKVGQTSNLKVTFTPANTTQKKLTYVTGNKNVATISAAGEIKGVHAGSTIITVYALNKNVLAKCNVNVSQTEIKLPTYKTGQNVGGKFFMPQVDRFNKKYAGRYKIKIEEVPQDSYQAKMKQLEQQNMLPPLVESGEKSWVEQVIIPNKKYYNLSSWLNSKPDLKARMMPDSIEYLTRNGGELTTLPLIVSRPIGMYYNSSMLTTMKRFGEMSYDEFQTVLGNNKVAFMTSENAWTTQLFLTSIIVKNGGAKILNKGVSEQRIEDVSSDMWVNSFTELQKILQKFASSNTVGAAYADAANSFMSKKSAVIPNGPWMAGDFAPESKDKWSNGFNGDQVKGEIYPGNTAIDNVFGYWWWIPVSTPKEQIEAALAFLEFMTTPEEIEAWILAEGGVAPNMKVSDSFKAELAKNRILSELGTAVNNKTVIAPAFADAVVSAIGDGTTGAFPKLLPKLIDGSMTPKQFADELTKKAKEAAKQ